MKISRRSFLKITAAATAIFPFFKKNAAAGIFDLWKNTAPENSEIDRIDARLKFSRAAILAGLLPLDSAQISRQKNAKKSPENCAFFFRDKKFFPYFPCDEKEKNLREFLENKKNFDDEKFAEISVFCKKNNFAKKICAEKIREILENKNLATENFFEKYEKDFFEISDPLFAKIAVNEKFLRDGDIFFLSEIEKDGEKKERTFLNFLFSPALSKNKNKKKFAVSHPGILSDAAMMPQFFESSPKLTAEIAENPEKIIAEIVAGNWKKIAEILNEYLPTNFSGNEIDPNLPNFENCKNLWDYSQISINHAQTKFSTGIDDPTIFNLAEHNNNLEEKLIGENANEILESGHSMGGGSAICAIIKNLKNKQIEKVRGVLFHSACYKKGEKGKKIMRNLKTPFDLLTNKNKSKWLVAALKKFKKLQTALAKFANYEVVADPKTVTEKAVEYSRQLLFDFGEILDRQIDMISAPFDENSDGSWEKIEKKLDEEFVPLAAENIISGRLELLIISGAIDELVPAKLQKKLWKKIKNFAIKKIIPKLSIDEKINARANLQKNLVLQIMENQSHMSLIEKPELALQLIEMFHRKKFFDGKKFATGILFPLKNFKNKFHAVIGDHFLVPTENEKYLNYFCRGTGFSRTDQVETMSRLGFALGKNVPAEILNKFGESGEMLKEILKYPLSIRALFSKKEKLPPTKISKKFLDDFQITAI